MLPGASDESNLTGENDLVILRKPQHFTLTADFERSQSSNAALSPDDPQFAFSNSLALGAGAQTVIAKKYRVYGQINVQNMRYQGVRDLDYNALMGNFGVTLPIGKARLDIAYQPLSVFDAAFKKRQLTQHRYSAVLGHGFAYKQWQLFPTLRVERVLSTPSDYNSTAQAFSLMIARSIKTKLPSLVYVNHNYERRLYDHYFESFVGTKRNDNRHETSIGLRVTLNRSTNLRMDYSWTRNKSTSDVNAYKARSGVIGIGLEKAF